MVVATGYNHTPYLPDWPGRDAFTGELLHACDYRNAEPYAGRDVLVVGVGNTGAEIAVDLVEGGAGRVRLAVRTAAAHRARASTAGLPTQFTGVIVRRLPAAPRRSARRPWQQLSVPDLSAHGLPAPGHAACYRGCSRSDRADPDVGLIDAVRKGDGRDRRARRRVRRRRGAARRRRPDRARGRDRRDRLPPRPRAARRAPRRARARRPAARARRPTRPAAPGLYFIGFTNPISGMFREIAIDARRIAAAVSGSRGSAATADPRAS